MNNLDFSNALLDFVYQSPTPFHAVKNISQALDSAGFIALHEGQLWQLQVGNKYYLTRNHSSIIAFVYAEENLAEAGIQMLGAHTDSPCLKVKPNADIYHKGYWQLGVEVYGGVLLNPWFDRDLALAGRVYVLVDGKIEQRFCDFNQALAMVPSLAIHLDREANSNKSVNAQKELPVLFALEGKQDFKSWLLTQLQQQEQGGVIEQVLDYELSFYDLQKGQIYGAEREFISSARLDNLLSCFVGLKALLASTKQHNSLLVFNDHEEVGSSSAAGADGPMLESFLKRLTEDAQSYARMVDNSWFISADNAHAVHPNYSEKHDANHGPLLNQGPVIKINANQRYASNSQTQAMFRHLCDKRQIPVQSFVVRSDMACGSTIGPITASNIGVKTVDIGVPTLAMHSIRETAGTKDAYYLYQVLISFFDKK